MKISLAERFWAKVARTNNENECWRWTGCKNNVGYGLFHGGDRMYTAHRALAIFILKWKLKRREEIQHICYNRDCVNPKHIVRGSMRDRYDRTIFRRRCEREQHPTP